MFEGVLGSSMMWKAAQKNLAEFKLVDLRDFGLGPRRQVDDTPYGGGDGMLLMIEPLMKAVDWAKKSVPKAKVALMTPKGKVWDQKLARKWAAAGDDYIFICGHYEGYDERITSVVDEQISVGDYILTGGELPAMTIVDSVVRLLPGVLGGELSAINESFSDDQTLEYPQYTRPEKYRDLSVPQVLLSGHHAKIDEWRAKNSTKN
jgi:tRNA (guanine37-N1)-methyltransferase